MRASVRRVRIVKLDLLVTNSPDDGPRSKHREVFSSILGSYTTFDSKSFKLPNDHVGVDFCTGEQFHITPRELFGAIVLSTAIVRSELLIIRLWIIEIAILDNAEVSSDFVRTSLSRRTM